MRIITSLIFLSSFLLISPYSFAQQNISSSPNLEQEMDEIVNWISKSSISADVKKIALASSLEITFGQTKLEFGDPLLRLILTRMKKALSKAGYNVLGLERDPNNPQQPSTLVNQIVREKWGGQHNLLFFLPKLDFIANILKKEYRKPIDALIVGTYEKKCEEGAVGYVIFFNNLKTKKQEIKSGEFFVSMDREDIIESFPEDELALILAVDSSSSMGLNDPKDMRQLAARYILEFTRQIKQPKVHIGVVDFDGWLADWIEPVDPGIEEKYKEIKEIIEAIDSYGGTDLLHPLKKCLELFPKETKMRKMVILLTDGRHDDKLSEEPFSDFNKVVSKLKANKISVWTVGLGKKHPDENLLSYIAEDTGAQYHLLKSPEEAKGLFVNYLSKYFEYMPVIIEPVILEPAKNQ